MGGVAVQGVPGTCGGGLAEARIECGKSLAGTRPVSKFIGRAQPKGQSSAGMSEEEMEYICEQLVEVLGGLYGVTN